jgi:hypothetical protein
MDDVKARLALGIAGTLALLSVAEVAGAPVAPTAVAARVQSVTVNFVRFWDNACRCYKARLSGQISSSAAGEEVVVLRQYCGRSFSTSVAGAITREGGFWEAELQVVSRPDALASESYRARWNRTLSEPVTFRGRLSVSRERLPRGRQGILVTTSSNNPVSLRGRQVLLQRQTSGAWTRTASGRLAPHPVKYYTFVATFTVPRRGWTVRALVPAQSAAPCFTASASEKWRS